MTRINSEMHKLPRTSFLIAGLIAFALGWFPTAASSEPVTIVALGDSLTAGFGLGPGEGFTEQLERELRDAGIDAVVVNAGVSGDTTSGGLARLDWSVGEDADAVIVELGGNDALRGISPEATRANLEAIITGLKDRGVAVLLAGMMAPPNMGNSYGDAFNPIFSDLAREHDVALYPFFLDGVAARADLNLADGIHPNAEGVAIIVESILPHVQAMVERIQAERQRAGSG